jgi:hypothetical protein
VNDHDRPPPSWAAFQLFLLAVALTLVLIYAIDRGGGH